MPGIAVIPPTPVPALDNPPSISAKELHELLLTAHVGGNVSRRRFIDALHESRLFLQLGFPDIVAYADATFHFQRSQVLEFLRVSKALVHLPRLAAAFERGDLSWSLLAALTRVADGETETEWLEFLEGRRVRAVLAELKDAEKKRRKRPRRDGYGLPGFPVKLSFELSPQDHAVVERGLAKVAAEMGCSLDGAKPSPAEALLFLMLRVLETDPEVSVSAGRVERDHSPFTVVFHRCPDCRRAAVESAEGRVEVAAEAMDRIEASAEHVDLENKAPEASSEIQAPSGERDRPNTPAMRRALLHREGGRWRVDSQQSTVNSQRRGAASRQPPAASRFARLSNVCAESLRCVSSRSPGSPDLRTLSSGHPCRNRGPRPRRMSLRDLSGWDGRVRTQSDAWSERRDVCESGARLLTRSRWRDCFRKRCAGDGC
jgi:hypothetical protein